MNKAKYQLVHANIAIPRAPLDDPLMKGFSERIDEIDALAQGWVGFIAQPTLPDEGTCYPELTLVNVSIWDSVSNLQEFTYAGKHGRLLKRRAKWFHQSERPAYVLYWTPAGDIPMEAEIKQRHEHLHLNGPTPYAFTFAEPFSVEEMLAYKREETD